jgi:PAS domain S-box-containing protein
MRKCAQSGGPGVNDAAAAVSCDWVGPPRWSRLGIRGRLFVLLISVFIPVVAIQMHIYYDTFQHWRDRELQSNLETARAAAGRFDDFVLAVQNQEAAIGVAIVSSVSFPLDDLKRSLDETRSRYAAVTSFSWVGPEGRILQSSDPDAVGIDVGDRPCTQEIYSGRDLTVSGLAVSRLTGRPTFTICRGIRDGSGVLRGTVLAEVLSDRLDGLLCFKKEGGDTVSIVDSRGMLIHQYPPVEISWEDRDRLKTCPFMGEALGGKELTTIAGPPSNAHGRLIALSPTHGVGWVAGAERRQDEAFAPLRSFLFHHFIMFLLPISAGLIIAIFIARSIVVPLKELRKHATALGRGEKTGCLEQKGPFELQDLATVFQKAYGKLYATLESITDGFFSVDREGRFTYLNETGARILGLRREESLGRVVWDLFPEAVDRRFHIEHYRAMETKTPVHYEEFYPAPLNAWFECHGYPTPDGLSVYFRNITDRKQTETDLRTARDELELRVLDRTHELQNLNEKLARRNDLLESIFSNMHFLVAYMDSDFNFIRVNRAYAEADHRTTEFFPGKNHFELYPNEENERIFREVVATGEPFFVCQKAFEYPDNPDRGMTYWDWSLHPVTAQDGKVTGLVLSLVNVTERKRAEVALKDSEQQFREVLENSQDVLYRRNLRMNRYDYLSPATTKITGYTPEEFMSMSREEVRQLMHPDDLVLAVERRDEAIATGRNQYVLEYRFKRKDGSYRWFGDMVTFIKDAAGHPLYRVGTIRDITERKVAERHTQAANRILRLATEASSRKDYLDGLLTPIQEWSGCRCIGIRVVDHSGHIPYESHTGFSEEFWEQENWLSLTKDNCACIRVITRELEPQDACCMTKGGSFVVNDSRLLVQTLSEEELGRFRGVCIKSGFLSIAVIPIHHEGNILGAIHLADERAGMASEDIITPIERLTHLMGETIYKLNIKDSLERRHEEIEAYAKRLESVNQDLQEFAFVASHDLQEPLRKIRSFGEILSRKLTDSLDPEGQDSLARMTGAAGRMQELLQGLLKYSRVTTHTNLVETIDLNRVIQDTLSDLELAVKHAGGLIEVGPLPQVDGDEPQMRQLFQNLIGNAIKYRRKDKNPIIRIHGETDGETCRIFVEDNGIGFDEHHADLVFRPFQRLHGRSSEYEGTGMGLAICKKIVDRHGGEITAQSKPGQGSTFIVTLPVKRHCKK